MFMSVLKFAIIQRYFVMLTTDFYNADCLN
jgi:hypothetical protein